MHRRDFMKRSALGAAGMLVSGTRVLGQTPGRVKEFIDPLPIPAKLTPDTATYPGSDYYEIAMTEFTQQLHSQLPPTRLWGYGGSYPGPTIEARTGRPVWVKFTNNLPPMHLLQSAIDPTIPMGEMLPDVRTVVHLHGAFTPPQYDGHPEAWYTPGKSAVHFYPNAQPAMPLWYHDHAMGITRLNVYAGLAGLYTIRDAVEDSLNLPKGQFEIPLAIQDKTFNADGSLFYPTAGVTPAHPVWQPEFFGDTPVINGRVAPFLNVQPRRYRFRLLNASQARFYELNFGVPFWMIGSDGGFLPAPVPLTRLVLAPAERADVIVDFAGLAGVTLYLKNNAKAPFPGGRGGEVTHLMQFRVVLPPSSPDATTPPAGLTLPPIPRLVPTPGTPVRELVLKENMDMLAKAPMEVLINGARFSDPVTETPRVGTTEVWQFINLTEDAHPLHVHLVRFQVQNRQPFNAAAYTTAWLAWKAGTGPKPVLASYLTGAAAPPPAEESGWKDTAKIHPGEILRVAAKFDVPVGTALPADYIYHCHILEHEDNEMMRPFQVWP